MNILFNSLSKGQRSFKDVSKKSSDKKSNGLFGINFGKYKAPYKKKMR